ncbi:hypothetical protein [Streptomyces sp. NPDC058989]|uniref:hypothetical protein n=1 Tax=Streptomyces sp. NPDC058989 TaxID=3346686 RepID=UPI00369FA7E0
MQYRITAPVHGHTGVVAGVVFADGVATCCDPPLGAIEYFRRHGYELVCLDAEPEPDTVIGFTAEAPEAPVATKDTPPKPAARTRTAGKRGSDEE